MFVEFSSYARATCVDPQPFIIQRERLGVCMQDVLRIGSAAASYYGQCQSNGEVVRMSCDDLDCKVNCVSATVQNGTCIPFGSGGYIAQCLTALPSAAPQPADPPLGGKSAVVGIALGTVFGGLFLTLLLLYWRRRARGGGGCWGPGGRKAHKRYIRDKRPTLKQMLPRMSMRARQGMAAAGGVVDFLAGRGGSSVTANNGAASSGVERSALQEYEATIAAAAASAAANDGTYETQREGSSAGTPGGGVRSTAHYSPGSGSGGNSAAASSPAGSGVPGGGYASVDRRMAVGLAASAPSGHFSIEQRPLLVGPLSPGQVEGGEGSGGGGAETAHRPVSTASGHLMPITGVVGWGGPAASLATTPFGSSNALPKASAFSGTGSVLSGSFSSVPGSNGGAGSGASNAFVNGLRPLSSRLAVLSQAFKPSAKSPGDRASLRVGNIETRNPIPSISVHQTPNASPRLVVGPVLTQLSPRATFAGSPVGVMSSGGGAGSTASSGGNSIGGFTTAAGTTTYVNPNAGGLQSSVSSSPVPGASAGDGEEEGSGLRASVGRRGDSSSPAQAGAASGTMWAAAGVSMSPHPTGSASSSRGSTPSISRVSSPPALTPSSSERRLSTLGEETH